LKLCGYIYHQGTYTLQAGTEKSAGYFYRLPVLVQHGELLGDSEVPDLLSPRRSVFAGKQVHSIHRQERSAGLIPALSVRRTSSATDSILNFSIICLRCALIVRSEISSS
jgi:hypothetical protein